MKPASKQERLRINEAIDKAARTAKMGLSNNEPIFVCVARFKDDKDIIGTSTFQGHHIHLISAIAWVIFEIADMTGKQPREILEGISKLIDNFQKDYLKNADREKMEWK